MAEQRIRMVEGNAQIGGRVWRYAASDNDAGVWVLNVHGFLAGGGVYWRESTRLAHSLGVRVLNPSLPGFGGTPAFTWEETQIGNYATGLVKLLDALEIPAALVLGHSMGGAVAMQMAADHPDRVLGVVYRDGVSTPSWKDRRGPFTMLFRPFFPDLGQGLDIISSLVVDVTGDLARTQLRSFLSTASPDLRLNARALRGTAPMGAMLLACDFTNAVRVVADRGDIPVLPVWGRLDWGIPARTAAEFSAIVGEPVQWVWGGHCWMLARPNAQSDILLKGDTGRHFLRRASSRAVAAGLAPILGPVATESAA
ncbi:MAG: alpha/beta hydrolase [Actinobacteria bacterium]|nr:alpha/beta hydrolase [Actinomycetota bacterium]